MIKNLFAAGLMLLLCISSYSQADLTCDSTFYDNGGFQVDYADNEDVVYQICPDSPDAEISLRFDFVDIAVNEFTEGNQGGCWDFLSIYNGPDTLSPFLAETLCGEVSQSGQYPSDLNSLLVEGDIFTSTHPSGCLTVRFQSDDFITEAGWEAFIFCGDPCAVFDSAPVGLTKSFQPVPFPDGDVDRVQLKFYKELPAVKYSAADNAALDIEFWPVRDLSTDTPISGGDTSLIANKVKPGLDFFKWPVKFIRPDILPNTRYRWRLRTKCQSGDMRLSPWSEEKIFNTPDFDLVTGIYVPPDGVFEDETKGLLPSTSYSLYPNPGNGQEINISLISDSKNSSLTKIQILDLNGKVLQMESISIDRGQQSESIRFEPSLNSGMYFITVESDGEIFRDRFLVK